jgi:hypothetical protein
LQLAFYLFMKRAHNAQRAQPVTTTRHALLSQLSRGMPLHSSRTSQQGEADNNQTAAV